MSLESDLKTSLQANSTLTAVVGTRTEAGPLRHQQTLPAVTWHVITRTFEQAANRAVKGTLTAIQFDVWAATPAGIVAAAEALKTAILAFTTSTHSLTIDAEYDVPEPIDSGVFHRAITCSILT